MDNDFISDLAQRVTYVETVHITDLQSRCDDHEDIINDHETRIAALEAR